MGGPSNPVKKNPLSKSHSVKIVNRRWKICLCRDSMGRSEDVKLDEN